MGSRVQRFYGPVTLCWYELEVGAWKATAYVNERGEDAEELERFSKRGLLAYSK